MCGVPIHAAEAYLARLIRAGHRVAIAEQIESPAEAKKRGAKSVVNRAIVRVVTAGTLTEEALLDSRAANWLVAVARVGERYGLAAADISTGRFELGSIAPGALDAELARLDARRSSIAPEPVAGRSRRERWTRGFDSLAAERRLKERFEVATLDGFGQFDRAALCAAGGLLAYLDEVARESLPFLRPPVARAVGRSYDDRRGDPRKPGADRLGLAARRAGSLLAAVDRTVTGAGARLLAADLGAPLLDRAADRGAARPRRPVRRRFRAARLAPPAAARACPTSAGRSAGWSPGAARPRDLGQLRDGLDEARRLHDRLASARRAAALARRAAAGADRPWRAGRPARPARWCRRRRSTPPRAAISPKAMTPRSTRCAPPAARAAAPSPALEARYREPDRHRDAQDPPQQRARLPYRGAGPERRQADGGGIRASPTARPWPAWSASTRPTCTSRRCGSARPAPMRSPPRPPISRS